MRINVRNPFGQTGSTTTQRVNIYVALEQFTVETRPEAVLAASGGTSAYNLPFLTDEQVNWVMWEYIDQYGTVVNSGCVPLRNMSSEWKAVFGPCRMLAGDGFSTTYGISFTAGNRPDPIMFIGTKPNILQFSNVSPQVNWVNGSYYIYSLNSSGNFMPRQLYQAGYMGITGDMSDVYSPNLITALGGPVIQGMTGDYPNVVYNAHVPTLDEAILLFGRSHLTKFGPSSGKFNTGTMPNAGVLTSTPGDLDQTKFKVLLKTGQIVEIGVNDPCPVILIMIPTLKE